MMKRRERLKDTLWSLVWPPESFMIQFQVSNSELQGGSMFNFPRSWHTFSPVILHSLHLLCTNHLNLLNTCSLSPLVSPYAVLSACKVSSLLHALSLCSVSYMACSSLSHILHVTLAVIIVGNLFYLPIRMQTSKKLETDCFTAIPRTG